MSKIIIVGGSLGGLLAGSLLRSQGHEVDILEKVHGSLDGRGAGIFSRAAGSRGGRLKRQRARRCRHRRYHHRCCFRHQCAYRQAPAPVAARPLHPRPLRRAPGAPR